MEGTSTLSRATPAASTRPLAFVGIDLAKGSFQAATAADVPAARCNASFTYDADGIALLLERLKLLEVRTQELNRSHQATLKEVSKSIKHHLSMLDPEISKIEKQIADLIDSNSDWKKKADIMDSVKGIGIDTARARLAEIPEIGTLSKRQVASLAGLAPHAFESGQFKGKSSIWGGHATVRCTLYMGTMAATVHNPVIKTFYERLLAKGKLPMVALTACMRKLLTILNAMVRDGVSWNPEMAVVQA